MSEITVLMSGYYFPQSELDALANVGIVLEFGSTVGNGDYYTFDKSTRNNNILVAKEQSSGTIITGASWLSSSNSVGDFLEDGSMFYRSGIGSSWKGFTFYYEGGAVADPTIVLSQTDLDLLANENCVLKINNTVAVVGSTVFENDVLELTVFGDYVLTEQENYLSKSVGFGNEATVTKLQFILNDTKTVGTLTVNDPQTGFSLNVSTTPVVVPATPVLTIDENNIDEILGSSIDFTINGDPIVVGSEIYVGDVLRAETPNDGFIFFYYDDQNVSSINLYKKTGFGNESVTTLFEFTLSADLRVGTLTVPETTITDMLLRIDVKTETPEITGDSSVFLINKSQIASINDKRFKAVGDAANNELFDYGQYILSLRSYPLPIAPKYISVFGDIYLGTLNVEEQAPTLNNDFITIDLGVITVPDGSDFTDYANTTFLLHLPYAQPVEIKPNYAVGYEISVEYIVNVYTGDTTINVSSSRTNEVILTNNVVLGTDIPYITTGLSQTVTNNNVDKGNDNGVRTAYIEAVKVDSYLKDGFFTIPILDEGLINSNTGYITCTDIKLNSLARREYKEEIESILKRGIIIND